MNNVISIMPAKVWVYCDINRKIMEEALVHFISSSQHPPPNMSSTPFPITALSCQEMHSWGPKPSSVSTLREGNSCSCIKWVKIMNISHITIHMCSIIFLASMLVSMSQTMKFLIFWQFKTPLVVNAALQNTTTVYISTLI